MLSEESAQTELQKLYEHYDFDAEDEEVLDSKVRGALEKTLIKALMAGRLSFKEEEDQFLIVQKLRKSDEEITYKEMSGQSKVVMGKSKDDSPNGKCYALLGHLCGGGKAVILKLKAADLKLSEAIGLTLLIL